MIKTIMNVNLSAIDLNLFLVLHAVLEEQSATKAAARLHVTQSAVSNALGRLRQLLGDPLVVAPMNYDHCAIGWWTNEIAHADIEDTDELQRLIYGVYAVVKVHLSREEDLYVDAVGSTTWPADF